MSLVLISYHVDPARVADNVGLLRAVHAELAATRPEGLRYASYQLPDETRFVELVEGGGQGRLSALETFRAYRASLPERAPEPPRLEELATIGAYRFP